MADNTTTNKKRTADGNALSGDDMGSKATSAVPNNRVPQQNSDVNTHSMENMKKLALPKVRQIKRHQKLPAGKTVILQFLGTGMISVMPVSLFGPVLSTMRTGYCSSAGSVCAAMQGSPMASSCS